jgi:hypothetical protein
LLLGLFSEVRARQRLAHKKLAWLGPHVFVAGVILVFLLAATAAPVVVSAAAAAAAAAAPGHGRVRAASTGRAVAAQPSRRTLARRWPSGALLSGAALGASALRLGFGEGRRIEWLRVAP